jgi:hypothetical protein
MTMSFLKLALGLSSTVFSSVLLSQVALSAEAPTAQIEAEITIAKLNRCNQSANIPRMARSNHKLHQFRSFLMYARQIGHFRHCNRWSNAMGVVWDIPIKPIAVIEH